MFNGCVSLQSVDIPATVGAVGAGAFKDCESLEKITFTGVSSIGDGAFEGCSNLTTITLLSSSADPKSDARRKTQKKAGELSSNAFKGLNPNCMVVLDDGVDIPSSKANYLLVKEESDAEGVRSRVYSAERDIEFVEGYPLSIPYAFTMKDDAVVSFVAETKGWTPIVVPFDVETITDEGNQEVVVTLAEEDAETVDNNSLYGLPEGGEKFQSVEKIEANKPYFIYSVNDGKTIFSSKGTVAATPAEITAEGKDFTLHASYKLQNLPASEVYLLDSNSYAFIPAEVEPVEGEEEPKVEVKPFEVYATSPAKVSEILTGLPGVKAPLPTVVESVAVEEFKVVKEGEAMVIYSPDSRTETLYTADGKVAGVIKLNPGRNVIELPATGVYILNNIKIVF